jgi:signal transduction histidine kinase
MKRERIIFAQPVALDREIAMRAALGAFDNPEIAEVGSLDEAESLPVLSGSVVLVTDLPTALQACALRSVEDPTLTRWAVVGLGVGSLPEGECVPPDEWNVSLLARIFRYAVAQRELRRMNLKLRGDLMTVARRVSHDLRSPISCIRTNADMLREFTANDPEMLRSMASVIQESVDESINLIDRISLVLRASAETPKIETVNVGEIVAKVLTSLKSRITAQSADIMLPSEWPTVRGVPPWLATIWTNLVQNSLQHAGKSPKIRLTWERLVHHIRFAVADGGPGISSVHFSEIFTPFEQLHRIRTKGFGLSIVRRLVDLQGGECTYLNFSNGGSEFHFTLPDPSSS